MEPNLSFDPLSRMTMMIDLAELGVWDFDPRDPVLGWNGRGKTFFGLPPEADVTYELFLAGLHPDDRNRVHLALQAALNPTVGAYAFEFRTIGLNDRVERIIGASGKVIFNENKEPSRIIGVSRDLSLQRKYEFELKRLHEAARATSEAKSQFIANVSHELRTPLGAVIGFSDLALQPETTEKERTSYLHAVKRNGCQLLNLVNEVLDLSKVEAQKVETEKIQVPLDTLTKDLREMFHPLAQEKQLKFEIRSKGFIPRFIKTDPTRLKQILTNLIGNALKFTSSGHVLVEVSVSPPPIKGERMHLRFSVNDSGIGMSEEQRSKLFQAFTQGDESMTRRFGGTGIGLALSRKLAHALGGDVNIQWSSPGEGSCFVLTVPDSVYTEETQFIDLSEIFEHDNEKPSTRPTNSPTTSPTTTTQMNRLSGIKVLLADDARDNQVLVSRYLMNAGAEVDVAENGQQAVEKAEATDYDVVLMDLQMPIMSGYSATETLREHGFEKPIIALTAHAMFDERERCLRAGFTEHLTKPIDREKLLSEIEAFASHSGRGHKLH